MNQVERTGSRFLKNAFGTWMALVILYGLLTFLHRHGGPTLGPLAGRATDLTGLDASFKPGQ